MSNLQSKLAEAVVSATNAKEETTVFQRKLKEAEEDREHLKSQLANVAETRPRSVIAKELLNGFTKLLDAQFGAPDAGGDSLLRDALHEGTGDSLFEFKVSPNKNHCIIADKAHYKVDTLQKRIHEMEECQLCFEAFDHDQRQPVKIKCSHVYYCKACMLKCQHCPNCRKPFSSRDIQPLHLSFL